GVGPMDGGLGPLDRVDDRMQLDEACKVAGNRAGGEREDPLQPLQRYRIAVELPHRDPSAHDVVEWNGERPALVEVADAGLPRMHGASVRERRRVVKFVDGRVLQLAR